ncbi:hypothetical protein [Actinokineospora bangkokensis]|uniref:Uncharacterized protein n=1 Tax=Actinokineospora bangkokensis TaxID=1193682 RepID=A0A1Q9LJC0_9PSEU|nr:hypothetical protein [Actinokineospora bangkokensis]OLR92128.1 hypothetical protein BJP25_22560 [Actinokineospora bangkokensis]
MTAAQDPVRHDPVGRYKALLGLAHTAASEFREESAARAAALGGEIFEAGRKVDSARKAEDSVRKEVTGWWREVQKRVSSVSWVSTGRLPDPDPTADPDQLDAYLSQIWNATDRFYEAVRRAVWPRKF